MLRSRVLRVKHDGGAANRGPPHRFRIAPPLVADRDPELQSVHLEQAPAGSRHVEPILGRVDLVLGLDALERALRVDHECRNLSTSRRQSLHAEDGADAEGPRPSRHRRERAIAVRLIEREDIEVLSAQPGKVGFRKTDDARALRRGVGHELPDLVEAIVER